MKSYYAYALAVLACLQVGRAEDLQPMTPPSLPFNLSLAENFFDVNSIQSDPHIVGGEEVKPHSLPHQVALNLTIGQKNGLCGGSLISNRWIVTAAHCAQGISSTVAVLGAHNIKDRNEPTQTLVSVESSFVHPEWSRYTLRNDIALLKLSRAIEFDDNVKPIRLPSKSQENETFWNHGVIMSGWGKDSDNSKTVSPVLRSVKSRVVSNFYCNFRYLFLVVKDTHICASGFWAKSTCQGDSGGPLTIEEADGEKTLIGITSFGIGLGCQWSWPPVFTRVTSYLDWIHSVTGLQIRP